MTIQLYKLDELPEAQLGYSVDPDGNSLVSGENGGWKQGWLVIGYEDLCGDPIFIDRFAEECPVYTAAHGEGSWDPLLIASSIEGFAKGLEVVREIARGRENPVELESNPLPDAMRMEALEQIERNNPGAEIEFWRNWLDAQ